MRRCLVAALAAVIAFGPSPVFAWGTTGHRVVGALAAGYIKPATRAAVVAILGVETLADAANWPDFMRSDPSPFWKKTAAPWHYVTVPLGKTYEQVGAPPEGDAVTALARFSATLRSRDASLAERQLALRFIIHIVGDLHQPLHARRDTDRGGHDVPVTFFEAPSNLHVVWDEGIIDQQQMSYTEWAEYLRRRIAPAQTRQWANPDPKVWIAESIALRDTIYPENPVLSFDYVYRHRGEVELRLEQAGVRLATYLDAVFGSER